MPTQHPTFVLRRPATPAATGWCEHCASPIAPYPADPRAWLHTTTGLLRCVDTPASTTAAPDVPFADGDAADDAGDR